MLVGMSRAGLRKADGHSEQEIGIRDTGELLVKGVAGVGTEVIDGLGFQVDEQHAERDLVRSVGERDIGRLPSQIGLEMRLSR